MFYDCTSLKKVILSENLEAIKGKCFEGSGLVEIVIPKNVKTIGRWAF